MYKKILFPFASFLYHNFFFLYKPLYFGFKSRKDSYEISLIKKFIKPNDIILDIGANVGFYSNLLSSLTGKEGKVHCFEPDKKNFSYLEKTTHDKKNIVLNQKAVADKTGSINLYRSDTLNIDHRIYQPESHKGYYTVETVAIDDYVGDNYLVDFIKMDIQGSEYSALKGMQKTLVKSENVVILSEFWPYGLKLAGSSKEELFNYLKMLGFNIYYIDNKAHILIENNADLGIFKENAESYYNLIICKKKIGKLNTLNSDKS